MAIRKKATRRTEAKRKKTPVTKTATPTKTKTARNKRAMNGSPLLAPQLITGARMLYLVWIPQDPLAVAALVPKELKPEARRSVFMNQYVVDNAEQTSSAGLPGAFGAYSLTYLGADLEGLDAQPGTPGRWWTHYFNSSTNMIDYAKRRGVPAGAGETTLDFSGDQLIADYHTRRRTSYTHHLHGHGSAFWRLGAELKPALSRPEASWLPSDHALH